MGVDYNQTFKILLYLCKDPNAVNCEFIESDKTVGGKAKDCKDGYFLTKDYQCVQNDKNDYLQKLKHINIGISSGVSFLMILSQIFNLASIGP